MSGESGSGRLPSLNSSSGKPSLKFKPKAVARRTKEEREASAPKIKAEEAPKPFHDKKRDNRKNNGTSNQQRRLAKFLNNTHVISSGPLAAGNFVSEKGSDMRRGFIKSEGGMSSLVQTGLRNLDNGDTVSDDDNDEDKDKEQGANGKSKFNMGREYVIHEIADDDDEVESDNSGELDEEALQAKRVEELFPVRPLRIRHEDLEVVEKKVQESLSDATSREVTPAPGVKKEETEGYSELKEIVMQNETALKDKLKNLKLESQFQSLDENETILEMKSLAADQFSISKKLNKLNNKPNRFILFQLPSKLPDFEDMSPKTDEGEDEPMTEVTDNSEEKEDSSKKPSAKADSSSSKKEGPVIVPQESLQGNVGSIRVHKSGKISVKIGNTIMDACRGAETTFLQDVIALNNAGETPSIEALGRVDGRIVVTPRF